MPPYRGGSWRAYLTALRKLDLSGDLDDATEEPRIVNFAPLAKLSALRELEDYDQAQRLDPGLEAGSGSGSTRPACCRPARRG